jgi:hypothetical protein
LKRLLLSNNLRATITSLFIVFLVHYVDIHYFGNEDKIIQSDGAGYYDYLPSIFIHDDFNRKDSNINQSNAKYNRFQNLICYVVIKDEFFANKYPIGTALLEAPFFAGALNYERGQSDNITGFEYSFHYAFYLSTLFYLFLGLIFLYKLLQLYHIDWKIIALIQFLIVFATSTLNYATYESSFSHIYSLFAINAFLYFSKSFFLRFKLKHFILASLMLGIIMLIRQINVLVILLLPFIAGTYPNLKTAFETLLKKPLSILYAAILVISINAIQLIAWYYQTGDFIIYSYQNEGFNFLDPQLINILFSYRKGLFIYTPICLIGTAASIIFLIRKEYFLFFSWLGSFIILTYIFSSWWSWYYGGSYGLRAYIEYYALFFIPLAILINSKNKFIKLTLIAFGLLSIPITIIQTYQYKEYILHSVDMNKQLFWDTFLETDERFRGYSYKKHYDLNKYTEVKKYNLGDLTMMKSERKNILSIPLTAEENKSLLNSTLGLIEFDTKIEKDDLSNIYFTIDNSKENIYWLKKNTTSFNETTLGEFQRGVYFFELPSIKMNDGLAMNFSIESAKDQNIFQDIKLSLFKSKLDDEIEQMILNIKGDEEWLGKIKNEAKEKGISLEENLLLHAKWVLNN